jgi:hypothetical protein
LPNTIIQIKRSVTNSVVTGLASGELAFTSNGYGVNTGVLYIGNPDGNGVSVIGGTYSPGTLTNYQPLVANSTGGIDRVITSNLTVGSILANGTYGTNGAVLTVDSTGEVYWGTEETEEIEGNNVTSIIIGDGLTSTQSPLTNTGTISVNLASNSGLQFSSGALEILPANGIDVTTNGINVVAGNGINVDANGVSLVVGPNFSVNSAGLFINNSSSVTFGSLTVSGNLIVSGTTTQIDTSTLVVGDNFIELADHEASSNAFIDNVDVGFYVETGNTSANFNSGLARIATLSSNANPYFKIFSTNSAVNTSAIDANASTGTLQAFLEPWGAGGAFVVNSSNMSFTANSTVSLNIAANTLSLSTALPVTSGGTGLNTIGADGSVLQVSGNTVVFAMLDGGTF